MVAKWWVGELLGRAQGAGWGSNIFWYCFRSLQLGNLNKQTKKYISDHCLPKPFSYKSGATSLVVWASLFPLNSPIVKFLSIHRQASFQKLTHWIPKANVFRVTNPLSFHFQKLFLMDYFPFLPLLLITTSWRMKETDRHGDWGIRKVFHRGNDWIWKWQCPKTLYC